MAIMSTKKGSEWLVLDDGRIVDYQAEEAYPPKFSIAPQHSQQPMLVHVEWDTARNQAIVHLRERGAINGIHITRSFDTVSEANQWIRSGFAQEMWEAKQDKTWTIKWSPAKRHWSIGTGNAVTDMIFINHEDAIRHLAGITERHAADMSQDKIEDKPKDYGGW